MTLSDLWEMATPNAKFMIIFWTSLPIIALLITYIDERRMKGQVQGKR